LIDHGATFDYGDMFHNPDPKYAQHMMTSSTPVDGEVHEWIDNLKVANMKRHLAKANVPPTLAAIAVNRLQELKRWSRDQRRKQVDRKQDHSGMFHHAIDLIKIHQLNEDGGLYNAKEIAQQRKLYQR